MNSFYNEEDLQRMGFKSVGREVRISRKASFYGIEAISIGDNVRIDDFCILSGKISLHSHIHISAYCALYGSMGIEVEDYSGISPRCTLFSAMDDFGGDYLIGPIHPENTIHITGGKILLKRYTQIGSGCTVFPNVILEEGSVIGAMSLVTRSVPAWTISVGIPAHVISNRKKGLLKYVNTAR